MPAPPPRKLKVAAAYFMLLGYSQETIAKKINRTSRTQQLWKKEDDWEGVVKEAKKMWSDRLTGYARRAVRRGLTHERGGWLALEILARFDDDWLPPAQRVLTGAMSEEDVQHALHNIDEQFESIEAVDGLTIAPVHANGSTEQG